ncbi:SubName: Full=Uncharacterized protein {ECO:0000313/EMBL:CCA70268.1} [Serendipita indica DSM 11827]|uniref:Uncharacterized protein n=1 Tax=Serendipita indica (strain DSM 11827) TaxID=1109443 RepID=G4TG37_SERID|nr:SubName: Full=Uncharacterized protein {ECO:0000313/EMBL:CCA70268.1} [Serendipita indica DSM 11827]CCA70268.1 hypothetical protein PIIN_04207 [Serendipita indica DSM 11827]
MRFTSVLVGLVFTTVLSVANASQSAHPEHSNHNEHGGTHGGASVVVHGVSSKSASPAAVPNTTPGAHHQNSVAAVLDGHQQPLAVQAGHDAEGVVPKTAANELKANSEVVSESTKAPEGVESKQSADNTSSDSAPAQPKMRMVRRVRRAPIVEASVTGESAFLKREIQLERIQARSGGMYESTVVKANRLARRFLGFLLNIGRRIITGIAKHFIKNKVANNNNHHRRRSPIFDEVGVVGVHARSLEEVLL